MVDVFLCLRDFSVLSSERSVFWRGGLPVVIDGRE